MEKSINNRLYFDYNATSPLSNKVINFLKSGDFSFGNASSLHLEGKTAKKKISQASSFILNLFSLSSNQYDVIFHSGGSEGVNAFFKGIALNAIKNKSKCCFWFSAVDHPCVFNSKETLELLGHKVEIFNVSKDGDFNSVELISRMKESKLNGFHQVVNFTVVNNETGVYWPLKIAEEIKQQTQAIIHVDAVQMVGKVHDWRKLSSQIDCYTFSAHKFGALKGIGFSIQYNSIETLPFISGGNQQKGKRAGTENVMGIESIMIALEELDSSFSSDELMKSKLLIEGIIIDAVDKRGEIVAVNAINRNLNTIFLLLYGIKAETLLMKFDMAGIAVSTGSACSSGVIKENRVLMNMGYSKEESRSAIRFSFSPTMKFEESKEYGEKIRFVLNEIIKK